MLVFVAEAALAVPEVVDEAELLAPELEAAGTLETFNVPHTLSLRHCSWPLASFG